MKKFIGIFILILIAYNNYFCQSDYEIVQSFKQKYNTLMEQIKKAESLDDCNSIYSRAKELYEEYSRHSSLLDNSLYPESFESSFEKLFNAISLRQNEFTQITELKTEIVNLKTELTELNEQNKDLLARITVLRRQVDKDAATIAALNNMIAQLKSNLEKRDLLIRDIIDSLILDFAQVSSSLNEAEKLSYRMKIDNAELFFNIERTLVDNIQFMKVTELKPEDIAEIKKHQVEFNKQWKRISPKLSEIYLDKKEKEVQLANINNLFYEWRNRIDKEIWNAIYTEFRSKELPVLPFNNGEEFVYSIKSFVEDEIKNMEIKGKDKSEEVFKTFSDTVYYEKVLPEWIPVLIDNNMITEADKDTIEAQLMNWKNKLGPEEKSKWYYWAVILLVAVVAGYLIYYNRRKTYGLNN